MNREDTLKWFTEVAKPRIEGNRGLFATFYSVYEYDSRDPYSFTIGYQPYSCGVTLEDGETCHDCQYYTSHGDCGEYNVYINEDGSIGYEGETYTEDRFEEFLNEFGC